MNSYRTSHASKGYGVTYNEGYSAGYNRIQWEYCERKLISHVFESLADNDGQRYLDFACGTGRITGVAKDIFRNCTGYDISEAMLSEAKRSLPEINFKQIDITAEESLQTFDVISAFRFFTNAEKELSESVLRALHGNLDVDGKLVLNIHRNANGLLSKINQVRRIKKDEGSAKFVGIDEFRKLLDKCGYVVEDIFWYSYLPKLSCYPMWFLKLALGPIERFLQSVPVVPCSWAQCFILVARKK